MSRTHSLDALHAIAVLMVIGHNYADEHLGFLHAGGFGVDLLLVLSGFLLPACYLGIPVKVNIDSGGKPNGVPERR